MEPRHRLADLRRRLAELIGPGEPDRDGDDLEIQDNDPSTEAG
jgi:hypothetical protein